MRILLLPAILLMLMAPERAAAQDADRFGVAVHGQGAVPVLGLADRFGPSPGLAVGIGRQTQPDTYWEVRLQGLDFQRRETLALAPDTTRSPAIADSLELSLRLAGAGIFMHRKLATLGPFHPFVSIGGGFYHWTDTRGGWEEGGVVLEEETRSQWSGGLSGGIGSELVLSRQLAIEFVIDYSLVFGELWPTLAVGLENVSTFQFAGARLGLRYYF